jgi:hypothetical protein
MASGVVFIVCHNILGYSLFKGKKNHNMVSKGSKDAEFYVDFKNINLPL